MRNRLVDLIKGIACDMVANCGDECDTCTHGDCVGKLADHLLENAVIAMPVKIGQTVYPLHADPRFRAFVESIEITEDDICFGWVQYDVGVDCVETWDAELCSVKDIGKTVFLEETEWLKAREHKCPLGGDTFLDCAGCIYSEDYHFVDGECVRRDV